MLRVLYITNIPTPYRIDFWNELGKHVDLTVWFEAANYKHRKWDIRDLGLNFKYEFLKGLMFGAGRQFNIGMFRKLKQEKYDVLIISCYNSPSEMLVITWLNIKKIPFIFTSDGGFPKKDIKIKYLLKKYLISSAREWLSSGSNCTRYLNHYGADKELIFEYPFSVDFKVEGQTSLTCEERLELKNRDNLNDVVVLTVGQFIHRKGIDVLLSAFKEIGNKNVSLVIIGDGPLKEEYGSYVSGNNLQNVVIKDFMQKDELVKYYKIADIFVLPTRYDIWGLVVNEAMYFGLPVIATNKTGAAFDLIEDGVNGYVVDSEDIGQLKSKLAYLIDNAEVRAEFSKKSFEKIQYYTIKNMVKQYLNAINKFHSFQGREKHE
ncbi:MAG: glycosyltransferase family 4 protein [Clostridia bacterium]|nr:glycosyltransferase family 4 protein [Clostridia bacterium]